MGRYAAVFLDRDGVLIDTQVIDGVPRPPSDATSVRVLPGVPEALARLRCAGFRLVMTTNQPDITRGTYPAELANAINHFLRRRMGLDSVYMCPHDDTQSCACRKPAPGMLHKAAKDLELDLSRSFMVGDRWRDVEAGRRAGCRTVLVHRGYNERACSPDVRVLSLKDATEWIVNCADETSSHLRLEELRVKLFADGADRQQMLALYEQPYIKGFTTNPTLMRQAGVTDYFGFAQQVVREIPDRPISLEVFSDDLVEMERQAEEIAALGNNVYVKIPISTSVGLSCCDLIRRLSRRGRKVNVTGVLTLSQVAAAADSLRGGAEAFVSVFAGRIADTGRDPVPIMAATRALLQNSPNTQLLWASTREVLNIFQANAAGCDAITLPHGVTQKLSMIGKALEDLSIETIRMFHRDSQRLGYRIR